MTQQLAFLFPPEYFQPKPRPLSRAARHLYWIMKSFPSSRLGYCFPTHGWLSKKLKVSIRSIIRWIQELVHFGIIECRRRGPRSNEYRFLKSIEKSTTSENLVNNSIPKGCGGKSRVTSFQGSSLYESKTQNSSPAEQHADSLQVARQNIGDLELGGKRADVSLIRKLARLLPSEADWLRLRQSFREFCRRDTVRGWGIVVRLAEQVAIKTS